RTDEPVSEGVVSLLEPFIDTILICSTTALAIIMTSAWDDRFPTQLPLSDGNLGFIIEQEDGRYRFGADPPASIEVLDGVPLYQPTGTARLAWHDVAIDTFYLDPELSRPFSGSIIPAAGIARSD